MGTREFNWRRGHSPLVRAVAPIDNLDESAPVTMDGGVQEVYLYDQALQAEVSVASASGVTTITVVSDPGWTVGETADVQQDDGTRHEIIFLTLDPASGVVTFAETTTDTISVGARVIKRIGPVLTGAEYGTPSLTEVLLWGYVREIAWDSVFIDEVQALIIEQTIEVAATGAHWEEVYDVVFTRGLPRP